MTKLKYRKGTAFIAGIPARDLTEEEVEKFGGAEILVNTSLYYVDFEEMMKEEQKDEAEQQVPAATKEETKPKSVARKRVAKDK